MGNWTRTKLHLVSLKDWGQSNRHKRTIMQGPILPSAYGADLPVQLEHVVRKWYLNRIPGSARLSEVTEELHHLLSKSDLTDDENRRLCYILDRLIQ